MIEEHTHPPDHQQIISHTKVAKEKNIHSLRFSSSPHDILHVGISWSTLRQSLSATNKTLVSFKKLNDCLVNRQTHFRNSINGTAVHHCLKVPEGTLVKPDVDVNSNSFACTEKKQRNVTCQMIFVSLYDIL